MGRGRWGPGRLWLSTVLFVLRIRSCLVPRYPSHVRVAALWDRALLGRIRGWVSAG